MGSGRKRWDALVLTAGNARQRRAFELQLEAIAEVVEKFTEMVYVFEDSSNVKIGSGGATLNALQELSKRFGDSWCREKLVLLIHSGGYSQRLLHVSAIGKVFMAMPDERTILEWKLDSLGPVLNYLGNVGGVFICGADTLETFVGNDSLLKIATSNKESDKFDRDMLLIAHESSLEVAMGHGVYVADSSDAEDPELLYVLQKPSMEELRHRVGAILPSGLSLTDSCYFMGIKVVESLLELKRQRGEVNCELCCYGDFLRPLGSDPRLGYLEKEDRIEMECTATKRNEWRISLMTAMTGLKCSVRLLNLGTDSFFHFGTTGELLTHFSPGSTFSRKFHVTPNIVIHSRLANVAMLSDRCIVEWSEIDTSGEECTVGEGTILSGVVAKRKPKCNFLGGRVYATLCLGPSRYATAIFSTDADMKALPAPGAELQWFSHKLIHMAAPESRGSLWNARLFPVRESAEESLWATTALMERGFTSWEDKTPKSEEEALLSFEEMLATVDIEQMLENRKHLLD